MVEIVCINGMTNDTMTKLIVDDAIGLMKALPKEVSQ